VEDEKLLDPEEAAVPPLLEDLALEESNGLKKAETPPVADPVMGAADPPPGTFRV